MSRWGALFIVAALTVAGGCARSAPQEKEERPLGAPSYNPSPKAPDCGTEIDPYVAGGYYSSGRKCLWDAYNAKVPAKFATSSLTEQGDSISQSIEVAGDGSIKVVVTSQDREGKQGAFEYTCSMLQQVTVSRGEGNLFFQASGCTGGGTEVWV